MSQSDEISRLGSASAPPWDEADRLAALDRYAVLDTPREPEFDDIVRLASDVFDAPISVVNLIASGRQWFKAEVGINADGLPLDVSICAHALLQPGIFVVPDTTKDPRFACNPLVTGDPSLRFYAGALLNTPEGLPLGTVCVLDTKPRPDGITDRQRLTLEVLARQVMTQLELRRAVAERDDRAERLRAAVESRREAEHTYRESEERLRLATESAEVGFWDVDVVDDVLIWPARVKAMFGISPDVPVTMRDFHDGLHPGDREATGAAFAAAADPTRRALYDVEYRTIGREDGLVRWVAAKGRGVFDDQGRCTRVIGTAVDVTGRKRTEQALRELNDTLELQVAERTRELDRAWRLSQELQVVASQYGVIEAVNARWTELLGWSEGDLIGTTFAEYVHPDDLDATLAAFAGIVDRPLTEPYAYRFRHSDGSHRWFGWTAAFEDGRVYAVGRDLTAEREQADELARAEGQLRQAQKMEAVGQLTGGIAHDFNNLLTGITGSLEMMQVRMAQGRTADVDRYVTAAQGAAKRAAALTHRLLAFSRRQTLAPKPTDVRALVNGMEELISRSVGPGVEVEVVHAAGLWPSLIDASQLENAVLNLCINARDAMPDGGRITIETGNRWMDRRAADERGLEPGQYISLCVSDTGSGMTPDVVAKVFEPFFTTKPIGMGTGLGLSMIYGFARQSGGTVSVYSESGQGTMVCVYLPRHVGEAAAEANHEGPGALPRAEAGETVLVIDDEPTVRMLVAEVLTDLGYTAIEAPDGAAGLKVVNSDVRLDLLVTDVGLPGGMNGRQVADAARALRPDLKVLFITGYAENAVLSHGHLDPGMHVMTKPFGMDALASRIRELIETGRSR